MFRSVGNSTNAIFIPMMFHRENPHIITLPSLPPAEKPAVTEKTLPATPSSKTSSSVRLPELDGKSKKPTTSTPKAQPETLSSSLNVASYPIHRILEPGIKSQAHAIKFKFKAQDRPAVLTLQDVGYCAKKPSANYPDEALLRHPFMIKKLYQQFKGNTQAKNLIDAWQAYLSFKKQNPDQRYTTLITFIQNFLLQHSPQRLNALRLDQTFSLSKVSKYIDSLIKDFKSGKDPLPITTLDKLARHIENILIHRYLSTYKLTKDFQRTRALISFDPKFFKHLTQTRNASIVQQTISFR